MSVSNMSTRSITQPPCPLPKLDEYLWPSLATPKGNARQSLYNSPEFWYTPNGFPSFHEEIIDDRRAGVSGFKPVKHYRESNEFFAEPYDHTFPLSHAGNRAVRNVLSTDITAAHDLCVVPDIDWTAYAQQALAFVIPRLNEGSSILNFGWELRDLKRMNPMDSLKRIFGGRHSNVIRSPEGRALVALSSNKQTRKEFLKELTNRLAGAHLNASFGIVPFVGDLVQMHDELANLDHRLEVLYKYANRPQVRHYRRTLPRPTGGEAPDKEWFTSLRTIPGTTAWGPERFDGRGPPFPQRPPVTVVRQSRWHTRPVYHATVRFNYSLPPRDAYTTKIRAKMEVLGLRLDPSIIWNAIPFSFLVDWVVDVSSFLKSFTKETFPITTRVTDMCHSMCWEREATCGVMYIDDSVWYNETYANYPPEQQEFLPTVGGQYVLRQTSPVINICYHGRQRSYDRRLGPKVVDLPDIAARAPKLRQMALAGSLLISNSRALSSSRYRYLTPGSHRSPSRRS